MASTAGEPPRRRSEHDLEIFGMVDEYIARFGSSVSAKLDPLDRDGFTDIRHGDVVIGVNVVPKRGVLFLLVRMGDATRCSPERQAHLYRDLLELNFLATGDCAFAIDERLGAIYLRTMRRIEGLNYTEFEASLRMITQVAEDLGDRLKRLLEA